MEEQNDTELSLKHLMSLAQQGDKRVLMRVVSGDHTHASGLYREKFNRREYAEFPACQTEKNCHYYESRRIAGKLYDLFYALEFALLFGMAVTAAMAAFCLSRPDGHQKPWIKYIPFGFLIPWVIIAFAGSAGDLNFADLANMYRWHDNRQACVEVALELCNFLRNFTEILGYKAHFKGNLWIQGKLMDLSLVLLAAGLLFLLSFINGANDVSKGIATLAGAGLASVKGAIAWLVTAPVAGLFAAMIYMIVKLF